MKRRQFIATAPALLALPAASTAADQQDPILPYYREWVEARRDWRCLADLPGNGNWDMPESKAAEQRESAAFWAIIEMTPTSTTGIAALIHVLWSLDGPCAAQEGDEFLKQANDPGCKLITALWRASSGQNGLPPD